MSGVVRSYCLSADGREKVFCFVYTPGEPVTSIYNLDAGITSICTIEVVRDCSLLLVPLEVLDNMVQSNLDAAHIYEKMLSNSLQRIIERDLVLASYTVCARYEWFKKTYPGLCGLVSKKDIASFLNMSSESLSRILRVFPDDESST
ncbi:MAG: Crp/Fnr family transcriptional regulator [Lachnospiraceae bacterium]|nr:Crp/Fnr family transcriptional regulator [Lachnospiraceae bacterium]